MAELSDLIGVVYGLAARALAAVLSAGLVMRDMDKMLGNKPCFRHFRGAIMHTILA